MIATTTEEKRSAVWSPKPGEDRSATERKNYHAGYSDGFYLYPYGSGDANPGDDYRVGFKDGTRDRGDLA